MEYIEGKGRRQEINKIKYVLKYIDLVERLFSTDLNKNFK